MKNFFRPACRSKTPSGLLLKGTPFSSRSSTKNSYRPGSSNRRAARIFSDLLASEAVPQAIVASLVQLTADPLLLLLLINVLLLFVGSLMDTTAAIIILTPVLLPVVAHAGMDPKLFGIVMCLNLVIGMATPPVGVALYLAAEIGKVRIERVIAAIWPLLLVQIAVLFFITYVPGVSLALPRYFGF